MPEENVEIVRRVYDAAARRDAEMVLALYDPKIEWDWTRVSGLFGQGASTVDARPSSTGFRSGATDSIRFTTKPKKSWQRTTTWSRKRT